MRMQDTITRLIEILPNKIEEGLNKLKELNIESTEFGECLKNTLTCNDLYNKITYVPTTNIKEDN
jgi:hypothetical protein